MQKKIKKNHHLVFIIFIIVTIIFFAVFTARLVDWQLVHGEEYQTLSARSTSYVVETDAVRGEILDKNGDGLVVNKTYYHIVIDKLYVDENELDATLINLFELMEKVDQKWVDTLPLTVSNNNIEFSENSETDIDELKELLSLSDSETESASALFDTLIDRYDIDKAYPLTTQRNLMSVHFNMEASGYSNSQPYVFADEIDQSKVSAIAENTQGISGVEVQTYLKRSASLSTAASHLLGALGSMSSDEFEELSQADSRYQLSDTIGKFGVEQAFESQLKGEGGTKLIQRNSDGIVVDSALATEAKPGNTVYLTIDSNLQKIAAESLETQVKAAKALGEETVKSSNSKNVGEDCEAGAVVMLSVKDFSVLACASYPTFDLNEYAESSKYVSSLFDDDTSPLYDRAFVGSFACGSIFKPLVAMAGLEEQVITAETEIDCTGHYDYYPTNVVDCMHTHGDLNVTGAITHSCNYFFAETGRRLGINTMYLYAQKFGLGEYTGVEVYESKGTLAGRDSTRWVDGNTVQAAIGQSDNAFTPLQLATYVATIANNGTRLKTHILSKITDYSRETTLDTYTPEVVEENCGVSQENIDIVQNAMLTVTQSDGTAYSMFGGYKVEVAAKTGTAENSGSDHTTFICYAPYDDPEVAIAVVIEHGAKSKFSMSVAKALLDAYFEN